VLVLIAAGAAVLGNVAARFLWPVDEVELEEVAVREEKSLDPVQLPALPDGRPEQPAPGPVPRPDPGVEELPDPAAPLPATPAAAIAEAKQVVDRLVEAFPASPDALEIGARWDSWLGNTAEAVQSWEKCLALNPGYVYAYSGMGSVAAKKGDYAKATALFRKALELDPASSETQIQLAMTLIDAGQPEEAISVLEKNARSDANPIRGLVLLGMTYLNLKDNLKAKQYYEAAIRIHPNHANAHFGLATACQRLGLKEEAQQYMEKFNKLRSEEKEIRRDQRTNYDDLGAVCQEVATVQTDAGRIYLTAARPAGAERLWQRAAALDPKNVSCRQALAWMYRQAGRVPEGLRMLGEIAAIEPNNPIYPLEIGRIHFELKEFEAAERDFEDARKLDPQGWQACAALARLYIDTGRKLPEALTLARSAVEITPSAVNYVLLGAACERNADFVGAAAAIEQAIQREPSNPEYRRMYEQLRAKK
jgi:tetratricopeptide (TPR) repeat protein